MSTSAQTGGWDTVAAGYDEFVTPLLTPLAEDVLSRIDLRPGMRLLDVAAGTGALSLPAARLGAQVIATDISAGMIERLKARASAEGLASLEARVMDACNLELEDDSFDVSASQLGVTVIPDFKRALSEMVRATKPAGQVLIVALGPPQKAEFFGYFLAALRATIPDFAGPPTDPPPAQFQVADPASFRERLAEAGLTQISAKTITFGLQLASATHLWGLLMNSNPMGRMLVADLTEEQRAAVRGVLTGMLRDHAGENGTAVLNVDVHIGRGIN